METSTAINEGKHMDFNRQNNRPAQRIAPAPRQAAQTETATIVTNESPQSHQNYRDTPKKHSLKHLLLVPGLAVALLGCGYVLGNYAPVSSGGEFSRVDTEKNQAVFLTNDQVYFGKIKDITDTAIVMEDIYYLQGAAQQDAATTQDTSPAQQQQTDMALTKLGNELHGPEDRMQINRDQVLFWENLKDDGKVSEAIKSYKP
jgi:hypothetical protein